MERMFRMFVKVLRGRVEDGVVVGDGCRYFVVNWESEGGTDMCVFLFVLMFVFYVFYVFHVLLLILPNGCMSTF